MDTHRFALLGFGNVGQAFARLLLAKRDELLTQHDLRWQVVAIMTGHHGAAVNPDGIDLESALAMIDAGDSLDPLSTEPTPQNGVEFILSCNADVLFENTPVSYHDGQPAIEHISAALSTGMHAITANKGPVVHAYRELTRLAQAHGRKFLFESTVMDGAPVFSLWRETLPAAELHSIRPDKNPSGPPGTHIANSIDCANMLERKPRLRPVGTYIHNPHVLRKKRSKTNSSPGNLPASFMMRPVNNNHRIISLCYK